VLRDNFRGLNDFFNDITKGALPADGGVFYLRGGYINIAGDKPYIRPGTPDGEAQLITETMRGDDDHPGYSDHQISEAMTARAIGS
jgi:phospholipase C